MLDLRDDVVAGTLILLGWRQIYPEVCSLAWQRPLLPGERSHGYVAHPRVTMLHELVVASKAEDALEYERKFGLLRR
jgi:hypothetical protein